MKTDDLIALLASDPLPPQGRPWWQNALALLQQLDDGFETSHVGTILIDGDGVPLLVKPFAEANEQGLAREEIHFCLVKISNQRWIEKALMIGCDEHCAIGDQVFCTNDA